MDLPKDPKDPNGRRPVEPLNSPGPSARERGQLPAEVAEVP